MGSDGDKTARHSQTTRQDNAEEKRNRLTLGISSLVAIVFLSVAAISLAYIGGVMSGRHLYSPRQNKELDANILKSQTPLDKRGEQKILSAEELEFARVLRGENRPPQPLRAENQEKLPEAAPPKEPVQDGGVPGAASEDPLRTATDTPGVSPTPAGISDYVFQLAAFRDEAAADRLRQELEGFGLRTRLEKDGRLCIVLVLIRGPEERVSELANIAAQLRLGAPLMRSRKPVPQ